jgi:hypothetical protein
MTALHRHVPGFLAAGIVVRVRELAASEFMRHHRRADNPQKRQRVIMVFRARKKRLVAESWKNPGTPSDVD